MARKQVPLSPDLPYHITARCHDKEWFRIPLNDVWRIMEDYLCFIHMTYDVKLLAFVLMNNHFHLIAQFPNMNLGEAMRYFMRETSRCINNQTFHTNQVYGGRYHKSLIDNPLYYLHAYKYVYRNPIEAGIIESAGRYPYSTLHGELGYTRLNIPIEPDDTLFENIEGTLNWIQEDPGEFRRNLVRKALRKTVFSLAESQLGYEHNLKSERY